MAICLIIAIFLNETIAHQHGKAIFFAIFMTAFITKIAQPYMLRTTIQVFIFCVAACHIALIFVIPIDRAYPGGLLFPVGIIDLLIFYFIFQKIARKA